MAFRGFPPECLAFYEGLELDNSRSYWTAHRDQFEDAVRGPMRELLVTLDEQWGPFHVFRPNRDVRFSKDKSPYKTALGAVAESDRAVHFYVQISAAGLFVGSGLYHPAPDQLERLRAAVDDTRRGGQLVKVVREVEATGLAVQVRDPLKTAPRGYAKDHPRIELLQLKGIVMSKSWPVGAWLGTKKAKERVVTCLEAARPLNAWIERAVGVA